MKEYISINAHTIRGNLLRGESNPPIRITRGKNGKPRYAKGIKINGPSELVYDEERCILKCGARLVLMADEGTVEIVR